MDNFFQENRRKIQNLLDEKSIAILFSDDFDKNFYYISGLKMSNSAIILKQNEEYLYTKTLSETEALWDSTEYETEEMMKISGFSKIYDRKDFEEDLFKYIYSQDLKIVFLDFKLQSFHDKNMFSEQLQKAFPYIRVENINPSFRALREIKNIFEIDQIKKAIFVTNQAFTQVAKSLKTMQYEYEVEALFEYICAAKGCKEKAFDTIAASGFHATTLHYSKNNAKMDPNGMILLDAGTKWNAYSSDITRVFPVSGKFSQRQKDLYMVVLEAQEKTMELMKEGTYFEELNLCVLNHYKKALKTMKLITVDADVALYYYHGVSHHLGLDTHDYGKRDRSVLKENMVLSCEPGLYVKQEGIGIRIEDDVWIGKTKAVNLSDKIVKKPEEIEEMMNSDAV